MRLKRAEDDERAALARGVRGRDYVTLDSLNGPNWWRLSKAEQSHRETDC
jgi:hypothetical protein